MSIYVVAGSEHDIAPLTKPPQESGGEGTRFIVYSHIVVVDKNYFAAAVDNWQQQQTHNNNKKQSRSATSENVDMRTDRDPAEFSTCAWVENLHAYVKFST